MSLKAFSFLSRTASTSGSSVHLKRMRIRRRWDRRTVVLDCQRIRRAAGKVSRCDSFWTDDANFLTFLLPIQSRLYDRTSNATHFPLLPSCSKPCFRCSCPPSSPFFSTRSSSSGYAGTSSHTGGTSDSGGTKSIRRGEESRRRKAIVI